MRRGRGRAQSDGPQVQISDTGTFGGALFLPSTQDMYRYQLSENVAYVRGTARPQDRRGLQRLQHAQQLVRPGAERRPTRFRRSRRSFTRQPSLYSQNFGLNGYTAQEAALLESFWQHEAAAYVQDRFRPTRG